jgi:hypothetical protein
MNTSIIDPFEEGEYDSYWIRFFEILEVNGWRIFTNSRE